MKYRIFCLIIIFQPLLVHGFLCSFLRLISTALCSEETEEYIKNFPIFLNLPQFHLPPFQKSPFSKNFESKITLNELGPIVEPPIGVGCISSANPCKDSKYRTLDGTCNNLKNPTWGSVNTPFGRLLPAKYSDAIQALPTSVVDQQPLPLPRTISLTLFSELNTDDPFFTLVTMSWSQIMAHDMSLAMGTTPSETLSIECCDEKFQIPYDKPRCIPLIYSKTDKFYSRFGVTCIGLTRTITDIDTGCNRGNRPAEQLVSVTHWMDASMIYGNSKLSSNLIRKNIGGRLEIEVKNKNSFPPRAFNVTDFCFFPSNNEPCYQTGDRRANQNPQVAVLQTLMLREHNRIADALHELNSHWDDEKLFEEARHILIAEYQWINFYEFLPIVLGYDNMLKYKLIYNTDGYTYDYDENVNPSILNEHATGAFRLFHSTIQGYFNLVRKRRQTVQTKRLSDFFHRPVIIEKKKNFDRIIRGLSTQSQEMQDQFITTEVTNFLFKEDAPFGADLKSVDILRSRDHAIATYNDCREFCNLKRALKFEDFLDFIEQTNVKKLKSIYKHPDDVELIVGGSLERLVPGTLTGPTFLCLLLKQFYITRVSDRYFFEAGGQISSFTPDQLKQIKKVTLARIFCDNGDDIRKMQPKAFHKISADNILVPCKNFEKIPAIDFRYWKEKI